MGHNDKYKEGFWQKQTCSEPCEPGYPQKYYRKITTTQIDAVMVDCGLRL